MFHFDGFYLSIKIFGLFQPLPKAAWDKNDEDEDDATLARKGARSATDIARARLDKLMKNPDKPVR